MDAWDNLYQGSTAQRAISSAPKMGMVMMQGWALEVRHEVDLDASKEIALATEAFLANGGEIQKIPIGQGCGELNQHPTARDMAQKATRRQSSRKDTKSRDMILRLIGEGVTERSEVRKESGLPKMRFDNILLAMRKEGLLKPAVLASNGTGGGKGAFSAPLELV